MPELRLESSLVDDRYLVERCLGRGSYAEIFLAYDQLNKGEPVIIKSLNTSLQGTPDPELEQTLVENFQNEAMALDRVRHTHIIQRLGHGTAADLEGVPFHYLVIEYMPGGDLWSLCRKQPLALEAVLFYFEQVAEALAYAHSQQVIHRDIKPNNLLLSADQQVIKIADFGVAKMSLDDACEITRVGTNVYAPPEHHPDVRAGELNEKLTPSADVYSMAKSIYTALTGRAPRQFAREPITELPFELASETWSGPMVAVFSKATASRVADRYQTVDEFWGDFARVRLVGAAANELDDEATIVRPRLSAESTVERAAPRPNFQVLANPPREISSAHKAKIVVELPTHADTASAHQSAGAEAQWSRREEKTRAFGSPEYNSNSAVQTITREEDNAAVLRQRTTIQAFRAERGLFDRMRQLISSEWLRRVFIIFLVVALIGLAASTYYHFADQKAGLPFFSQAKEGRIAGALNVNLRSDPFGAVLAAVPKDTRVRVVEERGGWMRVKVLEWAGDAPENAPDSGWVDGRFVRLD
ncbi:MAG TPA: serine/threonine protein kinase [Blastocatellia bacterium]|nr:serine/threonine protein kinase [Blastocatellia bacterium]